MTSDSRTDDALNPQNSTEPHKLSLGDPSVQAGNIAEPVWRRWREGLENLGGRSPLLHFEDSPRTRIELSSTHPGGLPQFITGQSTLLSSLIRDELALRNARLAANAITSKGIELRSVRGIESVHLAIGLAQWRHGGDEFMAPILLRPLAIRRYGRDFELKLKGQPFLNPELARALSAQFQITLDAEAFVALALTNGVFKPQPVIDRLRGLTSHLAWFNVLPRLVVSSFADVASGMRADADDLDSPILDALAGNPSARRVIEEAFRPVQTVGQDERPPATDTLLLDADEEQENVVAQIGAGNSLVVKTLPGTGGTQTIVNAIGVLVAQHKRVLVVSPRSLEPGRHRAPADPGRASGTRSDPANAPPRRHPVHRAQREGDAAAGHRGRRRARAPPQGTARLSGTRSCAATPNSVSRCSTPSMSSPVSRSFPHRRRPRRASTGCRSNCSRQTGRMRRMRSSRRPDSASSATVQTTHPGTGRRS